jgi:hypothetical protein
MRHSTITLTMDRSSHVGLFDAEGAVGKLPAIPGARPAAPMRATGTEGQYIGNCFAQYLPNAPDGLRWAAADSGGTASRPAEMASGRNPLMESGDGVG